MEMTLNGITLRAVRMDSKTIEIFVISEAGSQLRVNAYRVPKGGINSEGRDEEKLRMKQLLKRTHEHYKSTAIKALERPEAEMLERERAADWLRSKGIKVIAA
ncbi:MAG: hypothetical protein EBS90_10045 [Betaproteobacteria bacterium]|nr:hypothetical protein [Betaproteobacteria bacterium]